MKNKKNIYNHKKIEKDIQRKWTKEKIYTTKESKKDKFYILDMFPYPSGEGLHVGHPKGYIATDIISRMRRMQGFNVLHPMGFDAFGLPAENYALKTKTNPMVSVAKNVNRYKKQLEILGLDYDWSREINTTDPEYYKWTQWIFLQLFKKGLAFESFEPINWCPSCKTGLANEDIEEGKCERCGTVIEKKPMRQWVLKITDYAERLLEDLDAKDRDGKALIEWPEHIKESQRNWIGRSEGALIKFKIAISDSKLEKETDIEVFTTRPDTLFGVTYLVLAPEHALVQKLLANTKNSEEIISYINLSKNKNQIERTDEKKEKSGIELKGVFVINPANNEKIPVWIADYVLADYGTGAAMAVPAHDERDWDFAKKYGLEVKQVIAPYFENNTDLIPRKDKETIVRSNIHAIIKNPKTNKYLVQKWREQGWQSFVTGGVENDEDIVDAAKREVLEETGYKNLKYIPKTTETWEVHSYFYATHKNVNRYMKARAIFFELVDEERSDIHSDDKDKYDIVWLDESEVRDYLSYGNQKVIWDFFANSTAYIDGGVLINSGQFNGKKSSEIMKDITSYVGGRWVTKYKLRDWVFSRQRYWGEPIPVIHCSKCGIIPVPEKDLPVTLPKVKSYEPTGTGESPLAAIDKWVNVKCPKCKSLAKRETNTMPQWAGSSWYYLRYMDPNNKKQLVDPKKENYCAPVDMYVGGAEHATRHLIYARFWHKFLYDIEVVSTQEPFYKLYPVGLIMGEDGRKMSKRFGNVINPDQIADQFGADTLRIYEMFMGPFDQQISWSTDSIVGCRRFIEKIWRLQDKLIDDKKANTDPELESLIHKTIKKVEDDVMLMRFNTAISAMMIMINKIEESNAIRKSDFEIIIKLLSPFAPHMTDQIWRNIGKKGSIHISVWPKFNPQKIQTEKVTIVVQVNGKVRGNFITNKSTTSAELENIAKNIPEVGKWIHGKEIVKTIVIEGKLVNIVIKDK